MYRGTVTYHSRIPDLIFERFEVNPDCPTVEKIELELLPGYLIRAIVHVTNVASSDEGIQVAEGAVEKLLDRFSFLLWRNVADRYFMNAKFEAMDGSVEPVTIHPSAGVVASQIVCDLGADNVSKLKVALEKPTLVGERHFGLFRSAMKTENAVEQFLHLYHILLLFNNDVQGDVDAFIRSQEPNVVQTPSPKTAGKNETVYTRLRNEFAHRRPGVNLEVTKHEMGVHAVGLIRLAVHSIKGNP